MAQTNKTQWIGKVSWCAVLCMQWCSVVQCGDGAVSCSVGWWWVKADVLDGCWLLAACWWMLTAGCWLLAAGCLLLVACWLVYATGCLLLVAGCWMLVAAVASRWLRAAVCWLFAVGSWVLDVGCCGCFSLAVDCWLLVADCWLLDACCWLVAGCYLLADAEWDGAVEIGRRSVERREQDGFHPCGFSFGLFLVATKKDRS